jgi:uncharacterized OB-fold protein
MAFLGAETAAHGASAIGDNVDGAAIGAKVEFIFIELKNTKMEVLYIVRTFCVYIL